MKRILLVAMILISSLFFYGMSSWATTVTLDPEYDNKVMIDSFNLQAQNTVYPYDPLAVGCYWNWDYSWNAQNSTCGASLVYFDVSSLTGKTISSANLRLVTSSVGVGFNPKNWHIVALANPWNPATVTWTVAESLQYYTNSEIVLSPPANSNAAYDVDVTGIVQAWTSGTWNNYGLLFASTDYTPPLATSWDAFEFYSLEDTGQDWPKLIVTYVDPCATPGTPSAPTPANGATGVSTSPTLGWTSCANTNSYDVYFGTSSNPPLAGNTASTSYARSGLTVGTTYYWKIVAKNNCGNSTPGPIWSFTVGTPSCATPGIPSAPAPANGATGLSIPLTLRWLSCANTDTYDIYFGTSSNPPYLRNTISTYLYFTSGLIAGTTYYWKIVAKNNCGNSTPGPIWSFTVAPCATPGIPSTPTPANGATGISTSPTLSWASCANTNSYDFYFGTSSNPPYVGNTTGTNYARSGLSNSTTYYWKIVAKNSCGNSTSGSVWYFTTGAACATPGTPSTPMPSNGATGISTSPTLSWASCANTNSYDFYFGTSSNPPYVGNTTGTSYARSGLSNSTTYYWKIVAKNSCGNSTSGSVWYFTTDAGIPSPPTNVSASDGTYADKVQITWTASSEATSYTVYRATSTSSWVQKTALGTTSNTAYNDTTASVMQTYYYWVKATNASGTSGFSASNSGYRSDGRPSPPTNVEASDGTYVDKVQVVWTASPGATSYTVYRATSTSARVQKIALGTTSNTTYDDTTASVMKTYYYWVKATNASGTSGFSASNSGYRSDGTPGPPTSISASDGTYADKVQVTWTASSGATSYTVYRATSTSSWVQKTALGTTSNTAYNDTTASAMKTYYYWVKATNAYGTSGFSASNSGYRSDGTPGPPTNVSASDGTYADKVQITWTASPGATSYTVFRATSTRSWVQKTVLGKPTLTIFVDTTAASGRKYYYWVKATNASGTSGFSPYDVGYR